MNDFPKTSYSLIARVGDLSDGVSWAEFLRIYEPVVYRMARRRGLQDADAQEIIQQVFTSVSHSIDRWETGPDKPPFRAWLTTITRNAITKALTRRPRDRASGSTSVADQLNALPLRDDASEELARETHREIVRWCKEQIRDEFTEVTWGIFWKTAVEAIPAAEVAEQTGRSVGAVYVARHRVLTRLKERVAEVSTTWDYQDTSCNDRKQP